MSRLIRPGLVPVALLIALSLVFAVAAMAAENNSDYAKALKLSTKMAEGLNSYELQGTLTMANNVRGETGGMSMEAAMVSAARWPDRLLSSQTGDMFKLNLGTGPEQSWFYLGQLGNAFVGEPIKLNRDLASASDMDLTEEKIFNFYGGLGQFLLPADLDVTAETGQGSVTVNGKDVACQVFTSTPQAASVDDGQPSEGPRVIHFDPVSGLVLKSEVTVFFTNNGTPFQQDVSFTLSEFVLNGAVDEALFTFAPPAGTRVVEHLDRLTNPDAMTGMTAPDITFTDLEGNSFQLSDLRGQAVFIDFWATWCPPCKQEMPHIETLYNELGKAGKIKIIAASNEDKATIQKFLTKKPYSFPVVTVNGEESHALFKTSSIPAGFVIDAKGVIRAHMVGAQTEAQLRAAFAKAGVQ